MELPREPHLPAPKAYGRPRLHSPREILDAILYVLKSGCTWRLLPHDFPPWRTVYHYFRAWRLSGLWERMHSALRERTRTYAPVLSMDEGAQQRGDPHRPEEVHARKRSQDVLAQEMGSAENVLSWLGQNRRLSKDYERLAESSEAFIYAAMSRLMARRLARS